MNLNYRFDEGELEFILATKVATREQQQRCLEKYVPVHELVRLISRFAAKSRICPGDFLYDTGTYLLGQPARNDFHVPRCVVRVSPKMCVTRPADDKWYPINWAGRSRSQHLFRIKTIFRYDDDGPFVAIPDRTLGFGIASENYKPLLRVWRPLHVPHVLSNVYFYNLLATPGMSRERHHWVHATADRIVLFQQTRGVESLLFE